MWMRPTTASHRQAHVCSHMRPEDYHSADPSLFFNLQNCKLINSCFKPISSGMTCYVATANWYNKKERSGCNIGARSCPWITHIFDKKEILEHGQVDLIFMPVYNRSKVLHIFLILEITALQAGWNLLNFQIRENREGRDKGIKSMDTAPGI